MLRVLDFSSLSIIAFSLLTVEGHILQVVGRCWALALCIAVECTWFARWRRAVLLQYDGCCCSVCNSLRRRLSEVHHWHSQRRQHAHVCHLQARLRAQRRKLPQSVALNVLHRAKIQPKYKYWPMIRIASCDFFVIYVHNGNVLALLQLSLGILSKKRAR